MILKERYVLQLESIRSVPCEGFQCWLQRKEKLNENVARVCRKHRNSLLLPGSPLTKLKRFLTVDRLVNCINEKVREGTNDRLTRNCHNIFILYII